MTPERFEQLTENGGSLDLRHHALFLVTGEDRTRYLNGQITNDVSILQPHGETIYACALDAKGGLQGDLFVRALDDAYLIDTHPDLREDLLMRLERYIIADDVEINDVTETWAISHIIRDEETNANRIGIPGKDFVHAPETSPPIPDITPEEAEILRITHGIPEWSKELTTKMLPPEAGIQARAIHYAKGCYTGQEVISRMKRAGKTSRTLCQLKIEPAISRDVIGATIATCNGAAVGQITSACSHPCLDQTVGLGYVKSVALDQDALSLLSEDGQQITTAQFRPLPFQ